LNRRQKIRLVVVDVWNQLVAGELCVLAFRDESARGKCGNAKACLDPVAKIRLSNSVNSTNKQHTRTSEQLCYGLSLKTLLKQLKYLKIYENLLGKYEKRYNGNGIMSVPLLLSVIFSVFLPFGLFPKSVSLENRAMRKPPENAFQ
jgi:hypothetical protein